jgi:electron transport complex protein RnfC
MIKKPFFSLCKPKLKYPVIQSQEKGPEKEIPLSNKATMLLSRSYSEIDEEILKKGDTVKTGQRLPLNSEDNEYFISPVTGAVSDISEYIGYLGLSYTSISVDTVEDDEWDDEFKNINGSVSSEDALRFLGSLPGCPDFTSIINPDTPLDTIVIYGIDDDLLVTTNQLILKSRSEALKEGVDFLKELTEIKRIICIVPATLASEAEKIGVEVAVIDPLYPDALPELIMKKVMDRTVPASKLYKDMGVAFIKAEAVAALADAFGRGEMPVNKVLTLINKDGSSLNVTARIGTSVKEVLKSFNLEAGHGDRITLGGAMRGLSIYSEDTPVMYDTDAIMVQDREQVIPSSDVPCLNCGECVRVCPANVPVNMLVRLLENGLYEEAAQEYDLLSCIECGLCAYVCVARIPVFHFIMLGKYEFGRLKSMEESNA